MSTTSIACPHCGKTIAIEEILKHQVEDEIRAAEHKKHQDELVRLREQTLKEAKEAANREFEVRLKNSQAEAGEVKQQNEKLQKDFLGLSKQLRETLRQQDEYRIKTEKERLVQLEEERKRVREIAQQETAQSYQRKIEEMQKMVSDAVKAKDELSRKLEQGSQQTQGEVAELELEETLRISFPQDGIEPIEKGIHGADVRQVVKSPGGTICGTILWESKQTKRFDDKWIGKLKQDMRSEKADIPALVTNIYADHTWNGLIQKDGVWVCSLTLVLPLAMLLRKTLLDVGYQKAVNQHQGKKADLIYEYITGHEFRQQIEALVEVFTEMHTQIHKERTAFEKNWKQREGQLQRLFTSTAGIYGSLQGRAGESAVPQIRGLELMELDSGSV